MKRPAEHGDFKKIKPDRINIRWQLVLIDTAIYLLSFLMFWLSDGHLMNVLYPGAAAYVVIIIFRFVFDVYRQIWRYAGIQSYVKVLVADFFSCAVAVIINLITPKPGADSLWIISLISFDLLIAVGARLVYGYCYKRSIKNDTRGRICRFIIGVFGVRETGFTDERDEPVKIAIVGADKDGMVLAESLIMDKRSGYAPKYFIDINREKIGRQIYDIDVISEDQVTKECLRDAGVTEIVIAASELGAEERREMFNRYSDCGCKIKVYDRSAMITSGAPGKIRLREFDIEDLLFRRAVNMCDEKTAASYRGKSVLVTGGGGSIGSELCRQIALMCPSELIILDIYENGAYDIQQELKIKYKDKLDVFVEIVSVCNKEGLEKVFRAYQPQIVLHAAAHKHVPLMEKNCVEAVENNVFGTLNVVELAEKYEAERFIMISTDKAVNPTNVMGATKRVCEMITQSRAGVSSGTVYSATRFGNVLGSSGSVIPLFKRQIASGGPLTVTDKRINRYFMTIPEASQLVLQSGAMAKNGELFVLDMGQPVKILDMAENMIKLSGYTPYKDIDIIETGLRPGEKLYEELLVKTEELDKTENSLIFIERDTPLSSAELDEKLDILRRAVKSGSDEEARFALKAVVPDFHSPDEINGKYYKTPEIAEIKFNKPV